MRIVDRLQLAGTIDLPGVEAAGYDIVLREAAGTYAVEITAWIRHEGGQRRGRIEVLPCGQDRNLAEQRFRGRCDLHAEWVGAEFGVRQIGLGRAAAVSRFPGPGITVRWEDPGP